MRPRKTLTFIEKKIAQRIIPVAEFNKGLAPRDRCPYRTGYVMPLYHGWHWKRLKRELVDIYT